MILVTISMQILPNEVSCLVSKGGLSGLIISTAEDLREFGGFDQKTQTFILKNRKY